LTDRARGGAHTVQVEANGETPCWGNPVRFRGDETEADRTPSVVKIVAHQPIDPEFLAELGSAVDSGPANIHDRSSKGFIVTQGKKTVLDFHFEGKGIKYFSGVPYQGKIKEVTIDLNGKVAYKFSGDTIPVSKALKIYLDNDPEKAIKVLTHGNDTIILSKFDDHLNAGKGDDKVLGNGGNDNIAGGPGDDDLRGGRGDDHLKGNDGKDILNGGRGDNILNGGAGKDCYVFDQAPGTGIGTITKFQAGEKIKLDNADFSGIGGQGALESKHFHVGSDADHSPQHVIYDPTDGTLSYDSDGNGPNAKVQFAQLQTGLDLTNHDFLVI
jgi:Ca2+-binding RTX toxin-like protein